MALGREDMELGREGTEEGQGRHGGRGREDMEAGAGKAWSLAGKAWSWARKTWSWAGKARRQGQEAFLSHCMHPQRAESKQEVGLGSKASRHTPGTHFLQ